MFKSKIFSLPKFQMDPKALRIGVTIFVSSSALSFVRVGLHTFYCDQYVENFWKRQKFGFPMNLNQKLAPIAAEVLSDFNLIDKVDKIDFFSCIGYEPMRIGIMQFAKLFVGLPFFFDYTSEKSINKDEITFFEDQTLNWKRPESKKFLQNLVLSEKAKKYAIAEQLAAGQSWENLIKASSFFGTSLYTLIAYFRIQIYLQLKNKTLTPTRRLIFSTGLAAFIYLGIFLIFKFEAEQTTNKSIDRFLESIKNRQDYIDGGIEYYTKFQNRNILQRQFMADDGKSYFKSNGDVVSLLSPRHSISSMIEKLSEIDGFARVNAKE